jgi:hypothetical protein
MHAWGNAAQRARLRQPRESKLAGSERLRGAVTGRANSQRSPGRSLATLSAAAHQPSPGRKQRLHAARLVSLRIRHRRHHPTKLWLLRHTAARRETEPHCAGACQRSGVVSMRTVDPGGESEGERQSDGEAFAAESSSKACGRPAAADEYQRPRWSQNGSSNGSARFMRPPLHAPNGVEDRSRNVADSSSASALL